VAKRQKTPPSEKATADKSTQSETRRRTRTRAADPATEEGQGVILDPSQGARNDPMSAPGPGAAQDMVAPVDIGSTAEMTAGDENARPPDVLTPRGAAVDPAAIEAQASTGRAIDESGAPTPRGDYFTDESAINTLISERAYHLYLERGGRHGHAMDDWLQAEREVRDRMHAQRAQE
jgi:hypothetical protein